MAVNGSEDSRCEAGASKFVVAHKKKAVKPCDGETFKLNASVPTMCREAPP